METLDRIRWALRKVRLPVGPDALVLDVGAGSCPYPRADILLERYSGGDHRGGAGLVADRPTVLGDALQMPFQDKAFDFVVASHVLEHIKIPELLLKELMRVSHAGYIENAQCFSRAFVPIFGPCSRAYGYGWHARHSQETKAWKRRLHCTDEYFSQTPCVAKVILWHATTLSRAVLLARKHPISHR